MNRETKARVRKIATAMGYKPNYLARSLVKQRSNLLDLLVSDFRNTFYADIARVIQLEAEKQGFWIIQATTADAANMVLFLCSKAGGRISGQAFSVDGFTETLR